MCYAPAQDDVSIGAHLMRLRDPKTGKPLSAELLTGEFGVYFAAGKASYFQFLKSTLHIVT